MNKIFTLLLILLLLVSCDNKTIEEKPMNNTYIQISQVEAKKIMDEESDYIILDVREDYEYNESHIKGAILLPLGDIEDKAQAVLKDKAQLILVYCRSGNRSKTASQKLVDLGYTNILEFGGINTWPYEVE